MADKDGMVITTEKPAEIKAGKARTVYEPEYSIDELAAADLGAKPLTIRAALKMAGRPAYTLKEAKRIVEDFKKEAGK